MNHRCRDCGQIITGKKPVSTCPSCNSIYLVPNNYHPKRQPKKVRITLAERFISLLLGFLGGLITFFIWGIVLLAKGGAGSPKAAAAIFIYGIQTAGYVAFGIGITGFILGGDRLAKLLGILWGTDKEFNKKAEGISLEIPQWIGVTILTIIIVGAYGYLFSSL